MDIQVGDIFLSEMSSAYYLVLSIDEKTGWCYIQCLEDGVINTITLDFMGPDSWMKKVQ